MQQVYHSNAIKTNPMKTLKLHSQGQEVKKLQMLLNIIPDGIFGPQTLQAVLFFQKSQRIKEDGIVGPKTWSLIYDGWEIIQSTDDESTELYTPRYLPNQAYHNKPTEKKWIFLHHTAGWQNPYHVIDAWGEQHNHKIATEYGIGGQSIHNDNSDHDGKILRAIPNNGWAWHLIGKQPLHSQSIGIELCSFGAFNKGYFEKSIHNSKYIHKNKSTFYTYVGQEVNPDQVVALKDPFREYSYYHKYSEEQLNSLKELILHLAEKHNINICEGLPNLIRKKGVKAFDSFGTNQCYETTGIWSHTNVDEGKIDVAPQEGLIEMLLEL